MRCAHGTCVVTFDRLTWRLRDLSVSSCPARAFLRPLHAVNQVIFKPLRRWEGHSAHRGAVQTQGAAQTP